MANENVKNMIDSLTSGDNVAAQDSFKNALKALVKSGLFSLKCISDTKRGFIH